jgi:hypothetical protein
MNSQALLNGMKFQTQKDRAHTQMTLEKLIDRLKNLPQETLVNLSSPHSYRGYYEDLAFSYGGKITAKDALQLCQSAIGEVFTGYKGGDFQMGRNTPVWSSQYGQTGKKIMDVEDNGDLVLAEDLD